MCRPFAWDATLMPICRARAEGCVQLCPFAVQLARKWSSPLPPRHVCLSGMFVLPGPAMFINHACLRCPATFIRARHVYQSGMLALRHVYLSGMLTTHLVDYTSCRMSPDSKSTFYIKHKQCMTRKRMGAKGLCGLQARKAACI